MAAGSAAARREVALTAIIGAAATGAAWSAAGSIGEPAARGAALGAVLATCGAVAGNALTAWSYRKSQRAFFAALAAGILGRLALYGAALVYVALRMPERYDPVAMVAALLFLYVLFLVIEVRAVAARARSKSA